MAQAAFDKGLLAISNKLLYQHDGTIGLRFLREWETELSLVHMGQKRLVWQEPADFWPVHTAPHLASVERACWKTSI